MVVREADVLRDSVPPRLAWFPLGSGVAPWKVAALYLGVPAVFALYGALNNWKLLEHMGLWPTLSFYAAHAIVPWLFTASITYGLWRALRAWQPGLVTITLLGSLVSCALTIGYANWVNETICGWLGVGATVTQMPGADYSLGRVVGSTIRSTAIWVIVNVVCDRYLGYPRYRKAKYGQSAAASGGPGGAAPAAEGEFAAAAISGERLPAFMQRLTKPVSTNTLLAVHAEQHYIKVLSTGSQELLLYRMSDAVRELPDALGIQVHRSWWVSRSAVTSVQSDGKKMTLVLTSGLSVPVSTPYQALTRATFAPLLQPET